MDQAKRGRPPTGSAMTAAQRNRRYRERLKAEQDAIIRTVTINEDMAQRLGQMRIERDLARDQAERLQTENSRLVMEIKDIERQMLHISKSKHDR